MSRRFSLQWRFPLASVGRTFAVLNSTFFINSICHLWGRQPHGTSDSSRDSWLVSLVKFARGTITTIICTQPITEMVPAGTISIPQMGRP